ncbi:MAG: HAD hydrolase-like protein [Spirochaetaceae bacterium]|jgi:phosphoglycolate phosphatase-like HAD superfamily hydrolase|nr:HAD hydrolase-like protein [Spirochaetaceae bacterium]
MDYQNQLREFNQTKEFFIAIDSDGCAFDTMEIKHKKCFCPAFIEHYRLHDIAPLATEVWNHVNLYSKDRGINRFKGLALALKQLHNHKDIGKNQSLVPHAEGLKSWLEKENKFSMASLEREINKHGDPDLVRAYQWSFASNRLIKENTQHLRPYEGVKQALNLLSEKCDCLVSSSTSVDILTTEWGENGILAHVQMIAGQEMGSKSEHLALSGISRYESAKRLMLGDAPGDYQAAKNNGALFFPIMPGKEEESWQEFLQEGFPRFLELRFSGEYEEVRVKDFFNILT